MAGEVLVQAPLELEEAVGLLNEELHAIRQFELAERVVELAVRVEPHDYGRAGAVGVGVLGREDVGEARLYLGEVHGCGLWVGDVGDARVFQGMQNGGYCGNSTLRLKMPLK